MDLRSFRGVDPEIFLCSWAHFLMTLYSYLALALRRLHRRIMHMHQQFGAVAHH
ncbi:hypothetical protein P692DRAFT_201236264 [Suillus brevipes Sb2]|nr:hypothetical protein P692DRAFT_201236264 [Suillus brevipes Sb2]